MCGTSVWIVVLLLLLAFPSQSQSSEETIKRDVVQTCPVWGPWSPYNPECCWTATTRKIRTRQDTCAGSTAAGEGFLFCSAATVCSPVNCTYSAWSVWGTCSSTCGAGTQTRTRTANWNAACCGTNCSVSQTTQTQSCNLSPCPVNCAMTAWTDWSVCTASCYPGGNQNRTRRITTNASNGGQACGVTVERKFCNTQPCPVNCELTEWSSWGACSASCAPGGVQQQVRSVAVAPQNGGRDCDSNVLIQRTCNTQPCPENCEWSPFSEWSTCNRTCGGGWRSRQRTIIKEAINGGYCFGNANETEVCNSQLCLVDCQWNEWRPWSSCSISCGSGRRTRDRTKSAFTGLDCQGEADQTEVCNTNLCPINCQWTAWSDWGNCDHNCGGGTRNRGRAKDPEAQNGGLDCIGEIKQTEICNTQVCPIDCEWNEWSLWTKCCNGTSKRTRTNAPYNRNPCVGVPVEAIACNETSDCTIPPPAFLPNTTSSSINNQIGGLQPGAFWGIIGVVIMIVIVASIILFMWLYFKRKNSFTTTTTIPKGLGDNELSTLGTIEINDERPALAASEEAS